MSKRKLCMLHRKPQPEPCAVCAYQATKSQAAIAVIEPPAAEPEIPAVNREIPATNPVVVSVTVKEIKKRGRKPKFGKAMSAAERQALRRKNQKEKQQDAERRNLIAKLMRIYRSQQAYVRGGIDDAYPEDRVRNKREHERQYLDGLMTLSLADLQLALGTQEETPDLHGRLHNERSGEAKRKFGQSEIERIDAAQQHERTEDEHQKDLLLGFVSDLTGTEVRPLLAAGYKWRPEGRGPDKDDRKDETADPADTPTRKPAKSYSPTTEEKWLQETIDEIVKQNWGSKCPVCNETCSESHLYEQYGQGKRKLERCLENAIAMDALNQNPSKSGEEIRIGFVETGADQHYKYITKMIEQVRKQARKKHPTEAQKLEWAKHVDRWDRTTAKHKQNLLDEVCEQYAECHAVAVLEKDGKFFCAQHAPIS